MKYKIRDKVKVDYDATIYEIANHNPSTNLYYITGIDISSGAPVMRVRAECELTLVYTGYSTFSGIHAPNLAYPETVNVSLEMAKEMSTNKLVNIVCLHQFKEYFGLNERFEYCIKCDQKQGHL